MLRACDLVETWVPREGERKKSNVVRNCVWDCFPANLSCGEVAPVPEACLILVVVVQPDCFGNRERRSVQDGVRRVEMQTLRALLAAEMGRCWPLIWFVAHDLRRELCTITVERRGAGTSALVVAVRGLMNRDPTSSDLLGCELGTISKLMHTLKVWTTIGL